MYCHVRLAERRRQRRNRKNRVNSRLKGFEQLPFLFVVFLVRFFRARWLCRRVPSFVYPKFTY